MKPLLSDYDGKEEEDNALLKEEDNAQAEAKDDTMVGVFWINVYNVCNIVTMTLSKIAVEQQGFAVTDLIFVRGCVLLTICLLLLWSQGEGLFTGIEGQHTLMTIRNCAGTAAFLLFVTAITLIPMSFAFVILNAQPFFVSILAFILFRDQIKPVEILAMLFCFGCVYFMA